MHRATVISIKFGGSDTGWWFVYGTIKERAVVVTLTVKVATLPAVTGIGFAVTVHAAAAGTPEHAIMTFPEYPAPGVSCRLYVAVCPAATEAESAVDGLDMVNAAAAVPVTETL